jgi:hypothetical protein
MVPSTIVIPRDGSFALAFLGRVRRVHDPIFSVALGRTNLALKRIVDLVSCRAACFIWVFPFQFWPTTGVGRFRDFLVWQQVCKIFSSPISVVPGQNERVDRSTRDADWFRGAHAPSRVAIGAPADCIPPGDRSRRRFKDVAGGGSRLRHARRNNIREARVAGWAHILPRPLIPRVDDHD